MKKALLMLGVLFSALSAQAATNSFEFRRPSDNVSKGTMDDAGNFSVPGASVTASAFFGDGSHLTGISGTVSGLTTNKIPKAASASSLTDSNIMDDGTTVTLGSGISISLSGSGGNVISKSSITTTGGLFGSSLGLGVTPVVQLGISGTMAINDNGASTADNAMLVAKSSATNGATIMARSNDGTAFFKVNNANQASNQRPTLEVAGQRQEGNFAAGAKITEKSMVFADHVNNGIASFGDDLAVLSVQALPNVSNSVPGSGRVFEVLGSTGAAAGENLSPDAMYVRENGDTFIRGKVSINGGQAASIKGGVQTQNLCSTCTLYVNGGLSVSGNVAGPALTVSGRSDQANLFRVEGGSMAVTGQINIGWEKITNSCGAGVTTCTATCSVNKVILGGGCDSSVNLEKTYPPTNATWECDTLVTGSITAYALCARLGL